jgi:predicted RNA-binding protein with PUA-like domain
MPYWLMKSEPDEFSIRTLEDLGVSRWDGVRNYQARNFMRDMNEGDPFFFYHSSCATPGIAGVGRITRAAYPDPTAIDPSSTYFDARASEQKNPWSAVDVGFVERFDATLALSRMKSTPALSALPLAQKGSRLSVMPVSESEWLAILAMR